MASSLPLTQYDDHDYYLYLSDDEFEEYEEDDEDMLFEMTPTVTPEPMCVELQEVISQVNMDVQQTISECVICYTRQPSVIFLGCSHIVVCGICIRGLVLRAGREMLPCPYCRTKSSFMIGILP